MVVHVSENKEWAFLRLLKLFVFKKLKLESEDFWLRVFIVHESDVELGVLLVEAFEV